MGRVVLECNNICKKFKNKVILDDVSFKLCEGDIVGLIGKNGVGKTTLIKIILGLQKSSGSVIINGYDMNKDFVHAIEKVGATIENACKILNRNFIEKWLNNLKGYWFNKDIENATSLFKNTTYYQKTPFMKPYTTFEEIVEEWEHVKNENIKNIEFNILAIDDKVVIVEWMINQNEDYYNGIYEITFDDNNECIKFRSWEMLK